MPGPSETRFDLRPDGQGQELLAHGQDFVRAFHLLLKTAQIHDRPNAALGKPLDDLQEAIARLHRVDPSWEIRVRNDYLHLCDVRLRIDFESFASYHFVLDELKRRGIGVLAFRTGLDQEGLLAFVHLFLAAGRLPPDADALAHLEEGLRAARIAGVVLEPLQASGRGWAEGSERSVRRRSVLTFVQALFLTREILTAVDTRHVANIRRVKRLVSSLVDIMNIDESVLLGLINLKNYDEYTFNHSVNVCILAIATGRRLGLNRVQLGELGLAAIFHDLGKVSLRHDVIAKPGQLDAREWDEIERHPIEGVRKLVQIKGFNEVTNKLIVSVFRHHNNYDRTGYPPLGEGEEIPFFARIIRVADSYDAMTSARAYRKRNLSGVEAVEELWALMGSAFEPGILKVFVATVGIYPVGSVVQLSNGDVGVVVRNHAETDDLDRPVVRSVARWDGQEIDPRENDLREMSGLEIIGYCTGAEASATALDLLI